MSALVWHEIRGHSMWPLTGPIRAGVRRVAPQELQPGDIIAFLAERAPELWVHRVVRADGDAIVTRGDTNAFVDAPVPFSALLGRVDAVRLGRVTVPVPHHGVSGLVVRRIGQAWSQVAPTLRQQVAQRRWPRKPA